MRLSGPFVLALSISSASFAHAQTDPKIVADSVAAFSTQLGMTDIEVFDKDRFGADVRGLLPDGTPIEIEIDNTGVLEEIESKAGNGFAASSIESLMPKEVIGVDDYPADARFEKIELDDNKVELDGWDAQGRKFEAEFGYDGQLLEMKYDD